MPIVRGSARLVSATAVFSPKGVQFLRVLSSDAYWVDPEVYWQRITTGQSWYVKSVNLPRKWYKQIKRFNNVKRELERWHLRPDGTKNEDHFGPTKRCAMMPNSRWRRFMSDWILPLK